MAAIMAEVFARRGDSVLVLHGEDGLDEFTTTAPTMVWAVSDGTVRRLTIDAVDVGLPRAKPDDLRGGDASVNAAVAHRVFAGESGPVRDAVLLNAAAALVAYEGAGTSDLTGALGAATERAAAAVDSGAAAQTLGQWISVAQSMRPEV
jgi:anthranilate phosphoribosyltransferase